ncbi:MAG TPA: chemotaxis-specific protein-glutamate methyltransferase CheB [Polyangiaceae bacterium]|nr:chemotaxis-specific protein-glutamate methyltransferase CheB [Polyangiaceae bacterium]
MKIAIANDLPLAVEALRRVLAQQPEHQVIWVASTGEEAVEMCAQRTPDLLLLDLMMPGIGGVEATRQIMARSPCAILIATGSIGRNEARVFDAMGHGALDVVEIPALDAMSGAQGTTVLARIATVGRLIREHTPRLTSRVLGSGQGCLIAIGASAGGPSALATLLAALPNTLPAAIVIVQHVDAQFAQGLAEWLLEQSAWPVRLARAGDRPEQGSVLLAGTNDHLVLEASGRLAYTPDPVDYAYHPSVDVFFQSLAREWRSAAIGVLLTGMGRDGALGLKTMREKGHHTVAQDEASSAVFGMPKAAAQLGAAVEICSLREIGPRLIQRVAERQHWKV